mmetsp:Transcript_46626/g.123134  ORF Transcript_46626/g.123134 Transcript_46626/m.123134 type:complete len:200 (-) Transcript_46626:7-606(-)
MSALCAARWRAKCSCRRISSAVRSISMACRRARVRFWWALRASASPWRRSASHFCAYSQALKRAWAIRSFSAASARCCSRMRTCSAWARSWRSCAGPNTRLSSSSARCSATHSIQLSLAWLRHSSCARSASVRSVSSKLTARPRRSRCAPVSDSSAALCIRSPTRASLAIILPKSAGPAFSGRRTCCRDLGSALGPPPS